MSDVILVPDFPPLPGYIASRSDGALNVAVLDYAQDYARRAILADRERSAGEWLQTAIALADEYRRTESVHREAARAALLSHLRKRVGRELSAEELARQFHEVYERLAPSFGYETRPESRVPWDDVPANNKALMIAVCRAIVEASR